MCSSRAVKPKESICEDEDNEVDEPYLVTRCIKRLKREKEKQPEMHSR